METLNGNISKVDIVTEENTKYGVILGGITLRPTEDNDDILQYLYREKHH